MNKLTDKEERTRKLVKHHHLCERKPIFQHVIVIGYLASRKDIERLLSGLVAKLLSPGQKPKEKLIQEKEGR